MTQARAAKSGGRYEDFSIDRLLRFLTGLGVDVEIVLTPAEIAQRHAPVIHVTANTVTKSLGRPPRSST